MDESVHRNISVGVWIGWLKVGDGKKGSVHKE